VLNSIALNLIAGSLRRQTLRGTSAIKEEVRELQLFLRWKRQKIKGPRAWLRMVGYIG